jgi:DNA-binding response OmpR family regulator
MEEVDAGAHLAKELKALHNTKPVYLLSSVGDQLHQTIDSVALGLTGVFQKPVSFDTLLATLRSKLK